MCSNCEQIEKLKCQIAKLQRRVCELECNREFIINPQPCWPSIWHDTGTDRTDIKITNYTTGDEYK